MPINEAKLGDFPRPKSHEATARYRALTDTELIDSIHVGDPEAFREFLARFQPELCERARHLRIPIFARDELVADVLTAVALRFAKSSAVAPRSMIRYLTAALLNRFHNQVRASKRRLANEGHGSERDRIASDDTAMLASTSQSAIRAASGPDWAESRLPISIERLVSALEEGHHLLPRRHGLALEHAPCRLLDDLLDEREIVSELSVQSE